MLIAVEDGARAHAESQTLVDGGRCWHAHEATVVPVTTWRVLTGPPNAPCCCGYAITGALRAAAFLAGRGSGKRYTAR